MLAGWLRTAHSAWFSSRQPALTPRPRRLSSYYTFRVCAPTRASIQSGRYPWGVGFYDMSDDNNHCTHQFTASDNSVSTRQCAPRGR